MPPIAPTMPTNESTGLMSPSSMEAGGSGYGISSSSAAGRTPSRPEPLPTRDVEYDVDSHFSVLLQMHGSVWPNVLPWCLLTVAWAWAIIVLRDHEIIDMTIKHSTGHSFMSLLVSFLVVTRSSISYDRFMEARQGLADLFRSSREVVQYTCLLSIENQGEIAKKWRRDVAYRSILSIRMAIAAVEFRSFGVNAWESLELDEDQQDTTLMLGSSITSLHSGAHAVNNNNTNTNTTNGGDFLSEIAHGPRTLTDENFRAPIVWAYNLRDTCMQPRSNPAMLQSQLSVCGYLKILGLVGDFVTAFDGLKTLITTPFPFPLVQMTRTFLFFWVFSLPLVFASDNDRTMEVLVLMFFCTYGFLGLEFVSMEMDDPYGDDPNDFPCQ
jgi:predicted membrane chloride channel (bestrophin family)